MQMAQSSTVIFRKSIKRLRMLEISCIIVMMEKIVLYKPRFYKNSLDFRRLKRRRMKEDLFLVSSF
jgi:hypothetical protein